MSFLWGELNGYASPPTTRYKTAYDESDDVQYYRRVHITSCKRRKVWHDPIPVEEYTPSESPNIDVEDVVVPNSSPEVESQTERGNLEDLEENVDTAASELF